MAKNKILEELSEINPTDSVFRTCEHESTAQNILIILKENGGEFRKLSWEEYEKDLNAEGYTCYNSDKKRFEEVLEYTLSPEACAKFSSCWDLSKS